MTLKSPSIVLIDDDAMLLAATRRYLHNRGVEVRAAHSGFGMSHAVFQLNPDALVVDVMMPGLDGPRFAVLVRANLGDRLPIVFWSGSDESVVAEAAKEIVSSMFVSKASGAPSLYAVLLEIFARAPCSGMPNRLTRT